MIDESVSIKNQAFGQEYTFYLYSKTALFSLINLANLQIKFLSKEFLSIEFDQILKFQLNFSCMITIQT